MDEFELIRWIKQQTGSIPSHWLGIGDDAAVISSKEGKAWVISTDTIVEGVDFDKKVPISQAGRKALAVNLSDMAAMGAIPRAFLLTLGIPAELRQGVKLKKFLGGVFKLAKDYELYCVGGDITSSKQLFCSVTVWGEPASKNPISRSQAKVGDVILVTGSLGGSRKKKHYSFSPRVSEGVWLAKQGYVSSMIDLSDGLAQDLGHILMASNVSAKVDLEALPKSSPQVSYQQALSDGEDFELLLTVPKRKVVSLLKRWRKKYPAMHLSSIGEILKGKPKVHYYLQGKKQTHFSKMKGYRHF